MSKHLFPDHTALFDLHLVLFLEIKTNETEELRFQAVVGIANQKINFANIIHLKCSKS